VTRKQLRKASKKAKKRAKKAVGICLRCAYPLRRKDPKCPNCKRPSPLFVGKNTGPYPYLVKGAGGNVVPIWKAAPRVCWNGHRSKAGSVCCTTCGEPLAATVGQHFDQVVKSARNPARSYWMEQHAREPDPGRRALMWELAQQEAAGIPTFMPKATAVLNTPEAQRWRAATDPGEREYYWARMQAQLEQRPGGVA
jgi:hypothetical protein